MTKLTQLHADIDSRVQNIMEDYPDWLCTKGCDHCCRQLADVPQLTLAEWKLLRAGLQALPADQLQEISNRIANLSRSRPITCPLLDLSTGTCPVYNQRPVACRTYGFYVQRDKGLYCNDIQSHVEDGKWSDVVWGNHDTIDRLLADMGDRRSLADWFDRWRNDQ